MNVTSTSPFNILRNEINENVYINIITIENITTEFQQFMDDSLISIYLGNRTIDLDLAKQRLHTFITRKSSNTQMGAIAEFLFIYMLKQLI